MVLDLGGRSSEDGVSFDERSVFMKLWNEWSSFCSEEDGLGVVEILLVLVVVIGLVLIFKEQITDLLESIFKEIQKQTKEVY